MRQDGKTSYERVFNKAHSGPRVGFGERVPAHVQVTASSQKLHLRAQPQKHYSLWLGKRIVTGMHIVALGRLPALLNPGKKHSSKGQKKVVLRSF